MAPPLATYPFATFCRRRVSAITAAALAVLSFDDFDWPLLPTRPQRTLTVAPLMLISQNVFDVTFRYS